MKALCAALCLLLPVSLAHAQTAGEMLRSSEILQRGAHTEGGAVFLPPGVDARQCWGFMSAVQQFTTLADQNSKTFLNSCPPEDTERRTIGSNCALHGGDLDRSVNADIVRTRPFSGRVALPLRH